MKLPHPYTTFRPLAVSTALHAGALAVAAAVLLEVQPAPPAPPGSVEISVRPRADTLAVRPPAEPRPEIPAEPPAFAEDPELAPPVDVSFPSLSPGEERAAADGLPGAATVPVGARVPRTGELPDSTPVPARPPFREELPPVPKAASATPPAPRRIGPRPLPGNDRPAYPRRSRERNEQGTVTVRVRVGAEGAVETVEVVRSSGFERLDEAACRALREWRFEPAREGDRPIPGVVDVPVTFRLE